MAGGESSWVHASAGSEDLREHCVQEAEKGESFEEEQAAAGDSRGRLAGKQDLKLKAINIIELFQ